MIEYELGSTRTWFFEMREAGVDLVTNAHIKCAQEAAEFAENPSIEEAADVLISLMGAATARGWTTRDLAVAVKDKMVVNWNRSWEEQPDGTWQHRTAICEHDWDYSPPATIGATGVNCCKKCGMYNTQAAANDTIRVSTATVGGSQHDQHLTPRDAE
jgi:hypothetical protein